MKYDEITQTVTGSSADDWVMLSSGPYFLDRLGQVSSGDRHWVEIDSYYHLAVYRPDVNLRLAFGGIELGDDLSFEGWTWPDRKITRHTADAFWQGSLVARWTFLVVDGGHCYLPDPEGEYVKTGDATLDYERAAWTAKASEIALARLLNDLAERHYTEFDRYLEQSGIIEIPD